MFFFSLADKKNFSFLVMLVENQLILTSLEDKTNNGLYMINVARIFVFKLQLLVCVRNKTTMHTIKDYYFESNQRQIIHIYC